jgi:hypothetical protein
VLTRRGRAVAAVVSIDDLRELDAAEDEADLAAAREALASIELLRQRHYYYHQQHLSDAKNPNSCCGIGGTDVACPAGTGVKHGDS